MKMTKEQKMDLIEKFTKENDINALDLLTAISESIIECSRSEMVGTRKFNFWKQALQYSQKLEGMLKMTNPKKD